MNDLSHKFTKYSLYYASYYICRKIGGSARLNILYVSGWQPLFCKKMAATASFSFKIGGGQYLVTLLAAVLTWSEYWQVAKNNTYACVDMFVRLLYTNQLHTRKERIIATSLLIAVYLSI